MIGSEEEQSRTSSAASTTHSEEEQRSPLLLVNCLYPPPHRHPLQILEDQVLSSSPDNNTSTMHDPEEEHHAGGGDNDDNIPPPALISKRLRYICTSHEATLASLTTVAAATTTTTTHHKNTSSTKSHSTTTQLAELASRRSLCPQPPFDDGRVGGGSSAPPPVSIVSDLKLNPPERVAPHLIISSENTTNTNNNEQDAFDTIVQQEEADITDVVSSSTYKAMAALAALCDEVHELDTIVQKKFLPALLLFGPDPALFPSTSTTEGGGAQTAMGGAGAGGDAKHKKQQMQQQMDHVIAKKRELDLLKRMGKLLPTLQALFNLTLRCQRLARNMVVQLGGCATPPYPDAVATSTTTTTTTESAATTHPSLIEAAREEAARSRNVPVFGTGVHLLPLGEAIAKVLRILITIDCAVRSNEDLLEAWDLYKNVVREKLKVHREEQKMDEEYESFERLLVQLDFTLLNSRSFLTAIEQNFDPHAYYSSYYQDEGKGDMNAHSGGRGGMGGAGGSGHDTSSTNRFDLHNEIRTLLTILYGRYCSRINTENETSERIDCVGIYGMYCLYRRLLPSHAMPDVKLHKSLWSVLPAMCPVITLTADLPFMPREFIARYAPYDGVKGCNTTDPAELKVEAANLVKRWDTSFSSRVSKLRTDALGWLASADSDLSPSTGISIESTPTPPPSSSTASSSGVSGSGGMPYSDQAPAKNAPPSAFQQHPASAVEAKTTHLLRGLVIANTTSIMLNSQLITHKELNVPLEPEHVSSLLSLCEILKAIEKMVLVRRRAAVLSIQRAALKMVASSIFKRFEGLRAYADQYASMYQSTSVANAAHIARISTCLSALEGVLKGSSSFSPARRYAIAVAISACMDNHFSGGLSSEDAAAADNLLRHLGLIADFDDNIRKACDCSFLYFHQELLPTFVNKLYQSGSFADVGRMQLILSAFSDPARELLRCTPHLDVSGPDTMTSCIECYQNYIIDDVMQGEMIGLICTAIETDLRLAVHTKNLEQMKPSNPKVNKMKNIRSYLEMQTLYICDAQVNIKKEVEAYLESIFYNLSTVSLHDAHTYTEMRILAKERYGLELIDNQLPMGSLEKGVDMLHIMRNIQEFVTNYKYNLNQQNFVQRRPARSSKFLNTISVQSISASLRQHGLGIISTAVNHAYQFLSKKFQTFSEFLVDDYIQSLILKEVRWFEDSKEVTNSIYPFSRAMAFASEFRKLGVTSKGLTCLDKCRILVTEIGNSLGFVRMVQSAGRKYCSDAAQFLPATVVNHKFSAYSDEDDESGDGDAVTKAARNLDEAIFTLNQNLGKKSDYIRVLRKVFRGTLLKSDCSHLEGFFAIIPALCLSWIEASLQGKELMHKKTASRDGYFTDDGFAMGTAFILAVLGQNELFDALNWFASLRDKFASDQDDVNAKKDAQVIKNQVLLANTQKSSMFGSIFQQSEEKEIGEDEDDELTILNMMGKRIEGNKREMEILFYSMHGARKFFRSA